MKADQRKRMIAEELRSLLHYDPETGRFTWLVDRPRGRTKSGETADRLGPKGYHRISLRGKHSDVHRLAWLYMTGEWPPADIDHKDGNRANNRWENLRLATQSQNQANRRRTNNRSSRHKGVTWHAQCGKWQAAIKVHGRSRYLGLHESEAQAAHAYREAAIKHFGAYAALSATTEKAT